MPAATSVKPSLRTVQKEATRKRILATARRLFQQRGIAGVSMDEVAAAAGVGRATVYLHYSGKPALLIDLLAEDWERQARLFDRFAAQSEIDRAAVLAWLGKLVTGMRAARDSFELHRYTLGLNAEVAALHRAHRKRLAMILGRRFEAFADDRLPRAVESAMIIAELEYLAAASATEWRAAETEAAVQLMAERLLAFAGL